ncbi:Ig-like domain repeat protein [Variovorax paradoxus]|uniref:LysM peptidoglycan-binding domain-containing protein n=1 Tax=Variovorax paradoxus TaxID=34073 RepID=A0A6I6H5S9_VARPD|nr:Ig-like domain repeat protein [Variovorax paradoxus]QGW82230.1 LysM peptidoglycan-binding domain-containing protein [Variovorax paradoxus]
MVAIVSGNSLGLSLGSQATLGQRGQTGTAGQGRSGEQAYVNAATGNLVLQTRDELLLGRGPDTVSLRTYNSQGQLSDDNADNWAVGAFGQRMLLTGTVATAGSTLTRTDRDGAQAVYTWDAARNLYVSTAGAGAFDTIAHDAGASQFIWTDGDSGLTERYQASGQGRLVSAADASGNTVSYTYNANGTVQSATAANGDVTHYDYSGTNLTQIRTVTAGGATSTRVRYAYDGSNRLSTVTVDLSPDDNSVADGKTYVTTYTYDGASRRVASVSQSDGTSLAFTYVQAGGVYKVQSVTDALGAVTTFAYDTAAGTTTVTDALGAAAVYLYDAQGQLVQVRQGVTAGNPAGLSQVSYVYDAAGNLTLVTDGEGHKVALTYDERGNLLKEVDSAGDTRTRTYSAANQLLTDTLYADAATSRGAFSKEAALPETVRYVYAQNNPYQLRFTVSAQGNVTEYSYDANGLRTSAVEYAGAPYDTAALAQTAVPTEAQMTTWRQGQDLTRSQRTDYTYDGRGELQTATTYGAVNASGQGDPATAATTQYIYDPRGLLLQKIEPGATAGVSHYVYDGLGRLLSASGPSLDGGATANVTVTSYDDANARTTVTLASGLVTISAYDRAGRLVSVTQTSVGTGVLGTTTYAYDKDGNLLMTQDPTGVRKWMLYDAADRKIADIDATGAVIEYVYNANGQLRQTIAYATPIGTAALVDGVGKPTTAWSATNTATGLDAIRPAATARDQKVWRFYDTANRLTWQVDALGYVTQTTYDGASRILSVTQLANPVDVAQLGNGANIELLIDPATVGGITLNVGAAPAPLGTAVTLTATIEGTNPGGMVTFFSGETAIGSAAVVNGVATLVTTELPVGVNSIRAAYSGDVSRPASVSPIAQKTITQAAATSSALTIQPGTANFGEVVSLSVALTTTQPPGLAAATGDVKFYSGPTLIGTASLINGLAVLTLNSLPAGNLSIRAEYAGDATHASSGTTQSLTINPSPTKTTLQVSGSGSTLNLSATVATASGPSTAPGGTVTFYNGATVVGSAALVNGTASLQIAGPANAAAFKAVYSGNANNATSTTAIDYGSTVTSPTSTTLTASATSVRQGQSVTLTARVAGAAPSGTVTFFAGTTFLGTASVVNGVATFLAKYLPVGTNVVSAAYAGDANNVMSVVQGPTLQVSALVSSLPLGSSLTAGQSIYSPDGRYQLVFQADGNLVVYDLKENTPAVWHSQTGGAGGTLAVFQTDGNLVIYNTANGGVAHVWNSGSANKGAQRLELQNDGNLVIYTATGTALWWSGADTVSGPLNPGWSPVTPAPPVSANLTVSGWSSAVAGFPTQVVIRPSAGSAPYPGTFSIFDGQTLIASFLNPNGGPVNLPPMSKGTHTLKVVYSGDSGRSPAAYTVQLVVGAATANVAVTSSRPQTTTGAPVTFTAKITADSGLMGSYGGAFSGPSSTGTVTFYSNGTAIGTGAVVNGIATFTTGNLALGTTSITARYLGDANYLTAVSGSLSQQVIASTQVASSTTTLTVNPAGAFGTPLIYTAAVTPGAGSLAEPTGTVSFYNGTQLLGTVALVNGQASLSVSDLSIDAGAVSAVYSGDTSSATSIGNQAAKQASTITLTASATSVTQGQPVTLTAHVTGAAPSGLVTFFAGATFLGTASVLNGVATFVTNYLPEGVSILQVAYAGDLNNLGSVLDGGLAVGAWPGSAVVIPPLVKADGVGVSLPPASMVGASTWTQAYPIESVSPDSGYSGTFSFFDGLKLIASYMNPLGGYVALPAMSLGWHDLTVVYSGDASRAAAARTVRLNVEQGYTKVTLTSSRPESTAGAPLTFTAKVMPSTTTLANNPGSFSGPSFTGTVTFYRNGTAIGSGTVVNGVATFTTSNLALGTADITASYSGDSNYRVSSSGSLSQQVVAAPVMSSVGLTTTPVAPAYESALTLTATPVGQGKPEGGTVSFYDGAVLLGTVTLVNGKAILSVSNLEVGSHTIQAVYSGDASNATSQTTANVTITKAPVTLTNLTAASIAKDGSLSVQVGGVAPGGLVSFYQGLRLLGTAQVVNGVATLSGVFLPPGTQTFTAAYTGDAHYLDGELSFSQVVQGTPVTTIYAALDIQQDRTVTELYNRDGRLQGTLDAEGYLTEYKYNAAGELVQTVRYANRAANFANLPARLAAVAIARASYNLSGLRPSTNSSADIHAYNLHDAQGRLVGQVDGEGYLTETLYDARGNVTQIIRRANPTGAVNGTSTLDSIRPAADAARDQVTIQAWSAANQLLTRTNAEGTVTQFAYDSVGQLVETTTAVGTTDERTSRLRYDIQGRLIGQLDGRGSDAVALTDPLSAWAANGLTHTYDAAGRRTSTTDANGHRTLFFYDPIGRLAYTVNAMGEVTESRYNALGQLAEEVVYGSRVDVVTLGATTPGGLNTASLASQLAAVADPAKDTHVLHTYNATGTRASTTDALDSATSYSYNAFREATATTYALKSGYVVTDTASYDRRGLLTRSVSDATTLAITRRQTYDAFGRVTERFDGNGNRSQVGYDRLGRIVTTVDALNASRTTSYDAFDRVLTQRDALNNTTSYSYNTANRSTTVTTPEGVTLTTVRTRQGQTQSVTDGRGNTTSYSYDKSGNLLQTAAALDGSTTITTGATYDKTGLKLTSTDANGVVTSYTYDAVNRLLTRTVDPAGLNLVTSYGYDAKGQTVRVADARGVVTATQYDLNGQVLHQAVDPAGLNLVTTYAYDTTGQVLRVTMPNGSTTQYTYDGAGRRVKEQVDPQGLNLSRWFEYDAAGNLTRSIDANGHATRYAYDADNRLVFTLDALGNVTRQEYDAEGRVVRRTSYALPIDSTGLGNAPTVAQIQAKVVASAGVDLVESRRYDRDGRLRFSVDGTGAVVAYTYDQANNVVETRAYANRINLATWNIASDPPVNADTARDERVRTVYDALNRATWKVDGAGNVVQYFHDANGNVTESRAYATALTSAALGSWNGTSAPPVAADATRDQRSRSVYDTANRATWNVDALGNVTQYSYDANGNIAAQRRYATPLTAAALAAWDGRTAPAPVADDAHDARVRNVHDAANRLTWSVDGIGAVSKTEYDGNGNVTRRSQYANPIAEGADPTSVVAGSADRTSTYLYDAANRQNWRVDALGAVTHLQYDGNGNVVDQRAYASTVNPGDTASAASLAAALAGKADDAHDVRIRNVYDPAGRLAWQADGTGAVTGFAYDGTGRLVRQVQYATPVSASALPSSAVASGTDRITAFAHDGAGRRTFTVDALGGVSRTVYDAFGNVTQQIGYANPIAAPTAATTYTDAALQGAVSANAGADRIQRFAYDQANRQVFAVDAQGAVTESIYDGLGQVVQSRGHAQALNTAGLSTTASVSDIRSRTALDAANDRVSSHVFNAGGQEIYSVDPLGFVSKTDYDGLGQVRASLHYALSIPAGTASTAAIAAAVVTSAEDRSKSFQYDAAGRVLSSVDGDFTESWTYDALDNKTSYTNAKTWVWQYEYDRSGRMLREISPPVELTAVTVGGDGRLQVNAGSSGVGNVITVLAYDSFGNLRSRTEGAGRPEQRTTTYEYDQLGRQVKVIYPPVGVYNPSGDTFAVDGLDGRHDTVQTLYTQTTYDALGNAVANRDIGGNYSYKTYDLAGRVVHEVDALGFVTGYSRNTFGDATVLTRYGVATGLAAGHPPSLGRAQVQATVDALVHDADRTLSTTYDRLGRGIEVREAAAYVHEGGSSTAQDTFAGKTTRNTYNTFGELTQVAQLKSAGTWTLSTNFYDRRGQQIASVDAMGYLTTQAFDAVGNATMRIEYAKAVSWAGTSSLAGWTGTANAGGTPPAPVADANNDRRVDTTYDRNNRKTSEIRRNVEYSTASNGTSTRGDLTTSYGYDAVGNLTRTTDAKGASTYSYYDALGRVTAVAEPTRAGSDGATPVTPLTVFRRDAFGNVVMKTEYVNGADAEGNPLSPSALGPVQVPNPQLAQLTADGWTNVGPIGYFSPVPFAGSVPIYQIHATFFPNLYKYVTQAELASNLAPVNGIPIWGEPTPIGHVAQTQTSGTRPLYRMRQKSELEFTQLVADSNEIARLQGLGWSLDLDGSGNPLVLGYLGATGTGAMDTPLQMVMQVLPYIDPTDLMPILGEEHRYLAGTVKVDPMSDPSAYADAIANSDRTTFAQYDAVGHKVQSTDAMGVNYYSSYNSLGLIAKEWQGVSDNAGTTRTLFRAYQYDALGRQTHVLDPGTSSDKAVYTEGAAKQGHGYVNNPKVTVMPGGYGPNYGQVIYGNDNSSDGTHGDVPIGVDTTVEMGKFTFELAQLANLLDLKTAAGFRVEFDYITPARPPKLQPGTTVPIEPGVPAHTVTYGQDFTDMGLLDTATSVELVPGDSYGPIGADGSVLQIRVYQLGIVFPFPVPVKEPAPRWQGTQAQADGQNALMSGPGASGTVVDTALEYNAFGELVSKGVVGQEGGEYFDYDRAGRLWRTNAGDGVDKIALYDLQGRQTADIRSAGSGRGDINLRKAADAQQVAQLSDVRRTDTTYDLIGHILSQALPERQEVQGGVSVRTDALVGGIASRAVRGSQGWSGTNTVNLGWNALGGLGSGDVRVELYYIPIDAQGNEGPEQVKSQTLNATQGNGGASFSWNPAAGEGYGGIGRISRVVVAKKDLQANWQTLISQNGVGYSGQSLQVASPDDPSAWVQVQYRLAGSSGAWSELSTVRFGNAARGDLSGIPLGRYEYRAITHAPGQSDRTTSTGTFNITPRPLATFGVAGVNASAQTLDWQGPGAGDLQTIRVRQVGGSWSGPWGISRAAGSDWSTINLSGLGAGQYEYEILWTHPGEAGPYAHATGQINKVAETPPYQVITNVTNPEVAYAQSIGYVVESNVGYISHAPFAGGLPIYRLLNTISGRHFYTTSPSERDTVLGTPGWKYEFVSGYVAGSQIPDTTPLFRASSFSGGFPAHLYTTSWAEIQQLVGMGWTYNGPIGFVGTAANAVRDTPLVRMYKGAIGDHFYTAGTLPQSHTVPGTPAQYGWSATNLGPYAISQDPLLGGRQITQVAGQNGVDGNRRPVVNQNVDRWGNVVAITDPRSTAWKTTYSYNANNQMVRQVQTDADGNSGVDTNGNVSNANAPVTQIYYDAMGRQVAVRDANGNVNGQEWDAGGNLVRELHADGGVISHAYNAFGDKLRTIDAVNRTTTFLYDKHDRLVRTNRGSGTEAIAEWQSWDQAGRKLSQTNGAGGRIKYDYDLRGNLIRTTQPLGQTTLAAYDALNRKIIEMDANGAVAAWRYDYFGQLKRHTDIGGATYTYTYDNARQLVAQDNSRGQERTYAYDAAGQQIRIEDLAIVQTTSYRYDLAGRRVRETTVQGGITYQDNRIAYDALGRMRWVADTRAYISIDYDKVGNRTHVGIHVNDPSSGAGGDGHYIDKYYAYDAMNRQTMVDAQKLADGTLTLGTEGHRLTYFKDGSRESDTHNSDQRVVQVNGQWQAVRDVTGETQEVYSYDSLGRLKTNTRDGVTIDTRVYDGASRVLMSGVVLGVGGVDIGYINAHNLLNGGPLPADLAGGPLRGDINSYDANGRLTAQVSNSVGVTPVHSETTYKYDAVGNMVLSESSSLSAGSMLASHHAERTRFERAGGYQVKIRETAATGKLPGYLGYAYDANGYMIRTIDAHDKLLPQHRFVNDVQGTVLYADYTSATDPNTAYNGQRQMVVNGEVLGRYGMTIDQRYPNGNPFIPGLDVVEPEVSFSFGYQPIDGNYPAASPGVYAVQVNDTLQSIAKGAYGDGSLWYLIADANGLMSNADLRAGQVLTIPTRVTGANNVNTFKPYDPSKLANDTPTMLARPQDEKGCGGVGQVIVAVITAVVAIYTGGIGGAMLGSVVGQAAGVAMDVQDTISWKQVALAGVSAGVSAGLTEVMPTPFGGAVGDASNVIARAALGNALTQGVAVATGLQDKFSWKGVVASAAGAGVGWGVGQALSGGTLASGLPDPAQPPAFSEWGELGGGLARRTVAGFAAGLTTAVLRGGKVSVVQVSADAFGNALGDSIAAANGQRTQGVGPWSDADYRNGMDIQSDNAALQRQTQPYYDQIVGAFGQPGEGNRYPGVQLAAASGYSGMGSGSSDHDRNIDRMLNLANSPESSSRYVSTGDPSTYITDDGRIGILVSGVGDDGHSFIDEVRSAAEGPINQGSAMGTPLSPSPYRWVSNEMVDDDLVRGHWEDSAVTGTITNLPPTVWERTYLSPEVQHVMSNSITGKAVGGLMNIVGSGVAGFRSDGYNFATGKYLNPVQQRDARIDTFINAATLPIGMGSVGAARGFTAIELRQLANAELRASATFAEDMAKVGVTRGQIELMSQGKVPLGFKSEQQVAQFKSELDRALNKAGLPDAEVGLKGTSTTFYSENPSKNLGHHWDANPAALGDYDLNVTSSKMVDTLTNAGISPSEKYGVFKTADMQRSFGALDEFRQKWSATLGRDVNFVGYPAPQPRDPTEYVLRRGN